MWRFRHGYNHATLSDGPAPFPSEFANQRLQLSKDSFGTTKNLFFERWPQWCDDQHVRGALERSVIFRNAIGHSQVQPFRNYLLYTPSREWEWRRINDYMHCGKCREPLKNCNCEQLNLASPRTLTLRCLDGDFIRGLYGDIRTVDSQRFLRTAKLMDVAYRGIGWPTGRGGYEQARFDPRQQER